ncbi:MAG: heparinase II/III-family protein [Candidatus Aminicenantes bacterium]|nr:heparinase II/III-family protein [Candidatus Aminicenantes bacterium]
MIELKNFFPTQKERWLRKEGKKATPIIPTKLKFLLEKELHKTPAEIERAANSYLKGELILPGYPPMPKPNISCLKTGQNCGNGFSPELLYLLNRLSWLIFPAFKFFISNSEEIYYKIKKDILDWLVKNPPLRGLGWKKPEDIAIRAAVLTLVYDAIKSRALEDRKFTEKLVSSLFSHYLYLNEFRNSKGLEKHTILAGLLFSGIFLRKFSVPTPDFDSIMEEFISSLYEQPFRNGFFSGGSVEAHLFFFELSLYTALLLHKNKYTLGEGWERIESMGSILLELAGEDGLPRIGTEKNLFLFPFHRLMDNPGFLLSLLYSIRKEEKIGYPPAEGVEYFVKPAKGNHSKKGLCLKHGGLASLISGKKSVILTCMDTEESDKLSFIFRVEDKEFISDPGTFTFYSPYTKEISSTLYHSTVSLDGKEQMSIVPPKNKKLYIMTECTKTRVSAEFHWDDGSTHRRKIEVTDKGFEMEDSIISEKDHQIYWSFILHPEVSLKFTTEGAVLKRENLRAVLKFPSGFKIIVEPVKFSRRYGEVETTKRIIFTKKGKGSFKFKLQ